MEERQTIGYIAGDKYVSVLVPWVAMGGALHIKPGTHVYNVILVRVPMDKTTTFKHVPKRD